MKHPQNDPPLSPGRISAVTELLEPPEVAGPAPYSQGVRLAPSLQEHPWELHHPVDREKLGGISSTGKCPGTGRGHLPKQAFVLFSLPLCTGPRAAVSRGVSTHWTGAPRCFPAFPGSTRSTFLQDHSSRTRQPVPDSTLSPGNSNQLCQQL